MRPRQATGDFVDRDHLTTQHCFPCTAQQPVHIRRCYVMSGSADERMYMGHELRSGSVQCSAAE